MMDESDDPLMISSDSEDFLAPVTFDIKRKHDKLLKEFGW
jgi:hypothetical protein